MADTVVYINNRRVDYRKAAISVFDYTIHCGIGLFESILAVDDRLIFLEEHLDRMEMGMGRLGLTGLNYNRTTIKRTLKKAVSDHPGKVKKVKLLLTHGYYPLWPGSRPKPSAITIVIDHKLEFRQQKLMISPMKITTSDPLRGNKTLNFMTEWLSQNEAKKQGYDQGIIINQKNQIAETGSANIFMIKKGKVYTPPLTSGGLPGIIRGEIIRLLKVNHLPCIQKMLTPHDLAKADELFTTSSFKLVWPVVRLRLDKDYYFQPGPISKALFDRLKANFMTGAQDDHLII
jgi:branched-chain amino acid aminotransferase